MKKTLKWLDVNFEPICMGVLFYAMLGLITAEVILRFIFGSGISWSEEISRYLFVWLIYFSISYATRNNKHIRVSMILGKLPGGVQRVAMLVSDLLFFAFAAFLFCAAVGVCRYNVKAGSMAITVPVSINILYLAGVTGFFLMILRTLKNIWWKLRHWRSDLQEFENFGGKYFNDPPICFIPRSESEKEA